ncbi:glucose oxidase [Halenospora varia]|nr:glucose oxidase [Halenospora varia]
MHSILALLGAISLASAVPCTTQTTFDYIIVGAGTSGLVIANRLSEFSNLTVAVIEAGSSVLDNVNVTGTANYGLAFGTDIDYAFETTNQTYGDSLTKTMRAGKAIGGTSTINGMAYTRAEISQVNLWETLGSANWNWKELFPYYLKHEGFQVPTEEQAAKGASYNSAYHGLQGPLKIGWVNASELMDVSVPTMLNATYESLGVDYNQDVNGGDMVGWSVYPKTVDTALNIRHDAGRAYYYPIANRTNLKLFSKTTANKIVWSNQLDCGDAVASGVEVTDEAGSSYVIKASKEVIISAGALRSPLLLEASGVGNPSILSKLNIPTIVNLPTVGENLQDQTNTNLLASSRTNHTGQAGYVLYPTAQDVFGSDLEAIKASVEANLTEYSRLTSAASNNVTSVDDLVNFFKLQFDLIFVENITIAEILVSPSADQFDVEYWSLLPFSRGSIHLSSANASAPAAINPNYFMLPWDAQVQGRLAKYIREIMATSPLAEQIIAETSPGFSVVPKNATDAEWAGWVKTSYRSNFHPVATAAMMPREIGGVVDENLKVYGTGNVRVIDASVLPFQVCGHLVSTLYAVAERAADLIKAEM